MRRVKTCFLIPCLLLAFTIMASAAPVQWTSGTGSNNHWYEAIHVESRISWTNAKATAEAASGHLATATSEEENTFIFNLIDADKFWFIDGADNNEGPWLGGFDGNGDTAGFSWEWVTGETWSYVNWEIGEPNFAYEQWVNFFSNDASTSNPIRESFWNNVSDGAAVRGYVIEWDEYSDSSSPVPVPAAVWLLGSGLLGLLGIRKKIRK